MKAFLKLKIFEKIIIIFSLLSIFLLINYYLNYQYRTKYREWTELIMLSQRNSTLIEQMYINSIQLAEGHANYTKKLETNIGLFEKSFNALKSGGIAPGFEDENIKPVTNNNIKVLLNEIDVHWMLFSSKIYDIISIPVKIIDNSENQNNNEYTNPQYNRLLRELFSLKNSILKNNDELIEEYNKVRKYSANNFKIWQTIIFILSILIILLLLVSIQKWLIAPVKKIKSIIVQLQKGDTRIEYMQLKKDEIGELADEVTNLSDKFNKLDEFITEVGKGNLNVDYNLSGKRDHLGKSLLRMLAHLKSTQKQNEQIRKDEERQNWITAGLAKFADILRSGDKGIKELSNTILINLTKYLKAIQGGIYLYVEDDLEGEKYLNLICAYAYNRERIYKQRIELGEGLIGSCYLEKEMIYITDIPKDYVHITSGLGEATPNCLLIIPLIHDENVLGIIELASLNKFEQFEIDFISKLSENIAITMSSTAINERTSKLLARAQEQAEELQAQEEEMRQNLEEMQATQEEAHKRSIELHDIVEAINNSAGTYEISKEGKIIKTNKIYANSLGLNERDILGISHKSLIEHNFSSVGGYDNFIDKIISGNVQKKEFYYYVNNRKVWMSETYTPVHDIEDQIQKILVIVHEITHNKELEFATSESYVELHKKEDELSQKYNELNETYRKLEEEQKQHKLDMEKLNATLKLKNEEISRIIEHSGEGILVLNSNEEIISANKAIESLLAITKQEMLGKHLDDLLPEICGKFETFNEFVKYFSATKQVEVLVKGFLKSQVEVKVVKIAEGQVLQYIIYLNDLKEKANYEEKLNKMQAEFEEKEKQLIDKIKELGQERRALKEEKVEHLTEDIENDFIVWFNKYNLQISEIDDQHKRIVKLINEFKDSRDANKPSNELMKIVKNLINYASYHFRTEEDYFKEYKYSEAKSHSKEHKELTKLLQKVEKDLSKNRQDEVDSDLEIIKEQFINHFTTIDIKFLDTFKMFGH